MAIGDHRRRRRAALVCSIVAGAALAAVILTGWRQASALVLSCASFPPTASATSLQQSLGSPDVDSTSVPLGETEGDMVPATVLFPHVTSRRIEIVWKDRAARRNPRYVWLRGRPTVWKTPQGITIGTSLHELERMNGHAFHLAGFAFDMAGAVTSWDGGRLTALSSSDCKVRVWAASVDARGARSKWYHQVQGDRDFSSGHPAMQALNPRVSQLRMDFR